MSAESPGAGSLGVAFRTLGCKVNRVESESVAAELLGEGWAIVDEARASVIVVNTCTVTGEADAKARKAVRQALAAESAPIVVVTGCLAALDRDALEALGERVVVEADKEKVAEKVAALAPSPDGPTAPPRTHTHTPARTRTGEGFRTRVMVKVQDGCDNFCAYCIVPHARGVPRSVPAERVLAEVSALVADSAREVVLTGINIGRYRDGETTLAGLVELLAGTGVSRLRLSSIEPPDVTDELLAVMAEHADVVCAHLHVPLQSGSDAVLRAMGRRYSAAEFAERITAARAALPGLAITTDVIAGLPGETAEDAARTLSVCSEAGFSRLHVFRYSPRSGTPAAESPHQIEPAEKARRADALRALDAELRAAHAGARVGEVAEVLVERVADGLAEGTTRDYLRVRFPADGACAGDLVEVELTAESLGLAPG